MARRHTFILALSSIAAFASLSRTLPWALPGASPGSTSPASAAEGAVLAVPDSLFNATSDEVLALLGPPTYLRPWGEEFTVWGWQTPDGVQRSVTLYQGRVMMATPEGAFDGVKAVEIPKGTAYVGQRVDDLIRTLGQPDRVAAFPVAVSGNNAAPINMHAPAAAAPARVALVFGEDWLELHGGRVMRIGPKPTLPKITGPR